ncbi:MAG: YtfJ family protein [Pantoea sp.]|uniref:Transcriptional regulator n=1 Tax=Pantoea brenneri TaxID=472694 RepID=A0AAX3J9I7_9GAMM|nr:MULTISPECIES: YtfJ family protein [Pantoea]MBS6032909.1 YtfJ family protein [Pantoea sp.]MDH2123545.1 YtfJ family protein [Pantoea brenneri]VXC26347.1 putative transcriptional regulator [Pantoea brenneri]
MRITLAAIVLSLLIPASVMAHDLKQDARVPAVGVNDKGELLLQQDKFSYKNWNSAQLSGKVRVIQHIAGRSSAKQMNAALVEAIKAAKLPHDRYQTTTIVNTDDAIPGTGMFVRSSIESNKQQHPWSQFIVDDKGNVQRAWQLQQGGSAIVVLDKRGTVKFVKDGPLTQEEVQQVVTLVTSLLAQ